MKLTINNKEYDVLEAKTDEEKTLGLQNVESMEDNEGMIFIYDKPQPEVSFWMKDTSIPLDIIFIDEDWEVISVKKGVPEDETLLTEKDVQYVLELNQGSKVKKGMDVKQEGLEWYKGVDVNMMFVIGADGKPQMELEGDERIFSRIHTASLVKFAKKAYATKKDSDYKKLGKKMFAILDIQNTQEQQYVEK